MQTTVSSVPDSETIPGESDSVRWKIITDATDEIKACKVKDWTLSKLDLHPEHFSIGPFHKGGFEISIVTAATGKTWAEIVLRILASAERIGHGWHLSGSILDYVNACCDKPSVSGVKFIHVSHSRASRS